MKIQLIESNSRITVPLLLRCKQLSKAKLDKTYGYVRQTAKKTTFITFATYVFV